MKAILYLPLCMVLMSLNLAGQYAIDAAGSYVKNGAYSAAYSVGEVSTLTVRGVHSTYVSTSGVIQPDPLSITGTKNPGIATIRIYPNPVNDFLRLETDRTDLIQYVIYSMQGSFLAQGTVRGMSVQLDYLTPGMYLIKFSLVDFHESQSFLISKL
ncbi:MAG: T9SS type A sorting domain-containing protein [Saprospiraceae bacterium]|jgi:hypothetical protein|nr:T9SS type A sorting domain-containing protein [Saprospiraceae bacterium]MBK8296754.1 T9SS type A sorting domain-containing protein [Saprospiraceae bacterium]